MCIIMYVRGQVNVCSFNIAYVSFLGLNIVLVVHTHLLIGIYTYRKCTKVGKLICKMLEARENNIFFYYC